jgi:hypothetical protein
MPYSWNGHAEYCVTHKIEMEDEMPVVLWLLGVPLSVVILLALVGAF